MDTLDLDILIRLLIKYVFTNGSTCVVYMHN